MLKRFLLLAVPAMLMFSTMTMAAMDIVVATKEVRDDRRPHRVPAMKEISCEYDPAVGTVEVVSLSGTLITSVKLTNMLTGQTVVDVSETSLVILPVPSDGNYLLEITLANGREYYGTFDAVSE